MLEPADRREVERTLASVRGNYRSFYLVWPQGEIECPECGFDEFTQSAKDVSCTVCDGVGKIPDGWVAHQVYGRLQYYDFVTLVATGVTPGIEVGDIVSYVSTDTKGAVLRLRQSRYGYALIDADTFRPFSVAPTGVGHADEWRVEWKRKQMDVRATGY